MIRRTAALALSKGVGVAVTVSGTSHAQARNRDSKGARGLMRPRRLGEALLALFILGPVSVHGYEGDPSSSDAAGPAVATHPGTAVPDTTAQDQDRPSPRDCSLTPRSLTRTSAPVEPLASTQAHNDYDQCRPLYDALDRGFTSIEADVWLMDGRLLVGHERGDAVAGRSLERLYLSPLESRTRMNSGSVYAGWEGSFELLIDVKSEATATYAALDEVLRRHHHIMTAFTHDRTIPRAVTVIVSGNRDRGAMSSPALRYAGFEGRLEDLNTDVPASFMPTVGADWRETFTWDGAATMPKAQELRLRRLVAKAHAHGRTMRFWGTPDDAGAARDAVWSMLLGAGVDQISTDDVAGLATYLAS